MNRCKTNESYVGKGITLCGEWKESFDNFKDWAFSSGYDDLLYLNRIDKEQGYNKNSIEWVTKHEIKNTKKKYSNTMNTFLFSILNKYINI